MIRIYYMRLDGDCSDEQSLALYEMLPKERKESVDRAKNQEIAKKRLYTGAFLQHLLSKETGLSVEQLHYRYNEWGKPELDCARDVYFNLSHSGGYVVLAVSDHPVGADVEHKTRGYVSLAKRCFCEEEYRDIMSKQEETDRERCFLEYWTMKESYIKCIGEGMRIPLNSFQIEMKKKGLAAVLGEDMHFKTLFLDEKYCVSVCGSVLTDREEIAVSEINWIDLVIASNL